MRVPFLNCALGNGERAPWIDLSLLLPKVPKVFLRLRQLAECYQCSSYRAPYCRLVRQRNTRSSAEDRVGSSRLRSGRLGRAQLNQKPACRGPAHRSAELCLFAAQATRENRQLLAVTCCKAANVTLPWWVHTCLVHSGTKGASRFPSHAGQRQHWPQVRRAARTKDSGGMAVSGMTTLPSVTSTSTNEDTSNKYCAGILSRDTARRIPGGLGFASQDRLCLLLFAVDNSGWLIARWLVSPPCRLSLRLFRAQLPFARRRGRKMGQEQPLACCETSLEATLASTSISRSHMGFSSK